MIHGQTSTKYANLCFFRHPCPTLIYIRTYVSLSSTELTNRPSNCNRTFSILRFWRKRGNYVVYVQNIQHTISNIQQWHQLRRLLLYVRCESSHSMHEFRVVYWVVYRVIYRVVSDLYLDKVNCLFTAISLYKNTKQFSFSS